MSDMPTNYNQVFYDNFSGTSLNGSNWPVMYGGTSSNGAFTYDHGDVQVNNGLTINTTNSSGSWTTGGIGQGWTGGEYGLYQVEAKVDPGQGTGPVILLWPDNNSWPPEIDLLEAPNGQGDAYMTLHWAGSNGSNQYQTIDTGVNVNSWHDYAVDWEPNQLTFYVDGKQIWSTTQHIPNQPMGLGISGFVAASNDSWYGGGPDSTTPSSVGLHVAWASISEPGGNGGSGGGASGSNGNASGGSAAGASPITSQTTTGGSAASFTAAGDPSSSSGQTLYTSPGTDILQGGSGIDTFYVDATSPDGWAEIDNMHSGDVVNILGFNQFKSTITWTTATDPNGQTGATADISLNGDGHTDVAVTFAGVDQGTAQGFASGNWHTSGGTPYLSIWKV
ncbi:MAG: family 16 glycosylhydrolase [Rhodospirillales bacterium]|nr:family 16 glycosylhydrolase [Rhodospirillales bacterium]